MEARLIALEDRLRQTEEVLVAEELRRVGLSIHVENEDDEKYALQLELNQSKCCWTAGFNVLFV